MRLSPEDRSRRILRSTWPGALGGELRNVQPVILGEANLLDNRGDSGSGSAEEYWIEDRKVLTSTGAQTYTLVYTPIEESLTLTLNGLDLDEGFDYTVNWNTGVVTLSDPDLRVADVLNARYRVKAPSVIQTVGVEGNWQILGNAAKISPAVSGGVGVLYYALVDTGTPYNDVTAVITTPSSDMDVLCARRGIDGTPGAGASAGFRMGAICQSGTVSWIMGIGSGDNSGTAASGVTYPATIRAAYGSDKVLRIYVNGTLRSSVGLSSTQQAAFDPATFVGLATLQGSPGVADSISTASGVVDSFNRPDAPGLGITDTGDVWQYSP